MRRTEGWAAGTLLVHRGMATSFEEALDTAPTAALHWPEPCPDPLARATDLVGKDLRSNPLGETGSGTYGCFYLRP